MTSYATAKQVGTDITRAMRSVLSEPYELRALIAGRLKYVADAIGDADVDAAWGLRLAVSILLHGSVRMEDM